MNARGLFRAWRHLTLEECGSIYTKIGIRIAAIKQAMIDFEVIKNTLVVNDTNIPLKVEEPIIEPKNDIKPKRKRVRINNTKIEY